MQYVASPSTLTSRQLAGLLAAGVGLGGATGAGVETAGVGLGGSTGAGVETAGVGLAGAAVVTTGAGVETAGVGLGTTVVGAGVGWPCCGS
jgi:hypothetical protein